MKNSSKATEEFYVLLRSEIEDTFGKKIDASRDCIILSDQIDDRTSSAVSSNTLRRFFKLVKSKFSPSIATLDILCKYCGFTSFDEFTRLKINSDHHNIEEHGSESILNYLLSMFKHAPVKDYHDKTFFVFVQHTIYFLQRHPDLIDRFQRLISKTVNGQDFYFEQFVNADALNSYYGEGLRYYLVEKNTVEAQIFGHSLLAIKGWLSEDADEVRKHHDEVMKYHVTKSMHPALCARFFATQLYCAEIHKMPLDKIIIRAQQMHATLKPKTEEHRLFPHFEYVISLALLLTGHAEEALYYINYSFSSYPHMHPGVEKGFYQSMDLVKAITLAKTGRVREASNLYNEIHPSRFYFLTKKANTIMYIFLGQFLEKHNHKADEQLKNLIAETGFTRLNRIMRRDR